MVKDPTETVDCKTNSCMGSDFIDNTVNSDLDALFGRWWAYLDEERSRERNVTGPLHLVSLDRPIHALARRAVVFNDPKLHEQFEVSQYASVSQYYKALRLLCDRICAAMQVGHITPRDDLVGAPAASPAKPSFTNWSQLSLAVRSNNSTVAAEMLSQPFATITDPLFPSLMVDVTEFSLWAKTDGIAAVGEVERLLSSGAAGAANSSIPRSGDTQESATNGETTDESWQAKAKQYANEIYRRDKASSCDPSKLEIANNIARRFAEEGIRGPRFKLSPETIVRHGLEGLAKTDLVSRQIRQRRFGKSARVVAYAETRMAIGSAGFCFCFQANFAAPRML